MRSNDLLKAEKILAFDQEDRETFGDEYFVLDHFEPEDYIDTLAATFKIPFTTSSQMYNLCCGVKWKVRGKKPTVVTAACMFQVLERINYNDKKRLQKELAMQLGVDIRSVFQTMKEI